jgi:hypothetical protein
VAIIVIIIIVTRVITSTTREFIHEELEESACPEELVPVTPVNQINLEISPQQLSPGAPTKISTFPRKRKAQSMSQRHDGYSASRVCTVPV